jgi:hypothetical protein
MLCLGPTLNQDPPASTSKAAEITGVYHHCVWPFFERFLKESQCVAQDGLKLEVLLESSEPSWHIF